MTFAGVMAWAFFVRSSFFFRTAPHGGVMFALEMVKKYWYLQCFVTKVGLKPLF